MGRVRRALAVASATLVAAGGYGCFAGVNREADVDRTPVVNHGAGATIIYPGQTAPPHPGNLHPREAGYGQGVPTHPSGAPGAPTAAGPGYGSPPPYGAPAHGAPAPVPSTPGSAAVPPGAVARGVAEPPPEYASRGGTSAGTEGRPGVTMLGGAEIEETRHISVDEKPTWFKYIALPFAVLAAPFEYAAEKVAGAPEPAPDVPRLEHQPRPSHRPAPPPVDYESARLQDLERELAQRGAPSASPFAPGAAPAPGGGSGISDELAALRRRTGAPPPHAAPAPSGLPPAPAPAPAVEGGVGEVDRDGDGRPDHWIERAGGAIARERFDENFDGLPDRTLLYDRSSHEVVAIEEDTDFDGRIDTWTALRNGQVVSRRADGNGDGQVDTWSFYHGGVITRLERDANGDGYRDHVAYYEGGRLSREESDDDGDGRPDLVRFFDAAEQVVRVEEDANGDGEIDVVSHYESGRLLRREVLDATVLGHGGPDQTEHN